jgi:hypothetical protein
MIRRIAVLLVLALLPASFLFAQKDSLSSRYNNIVPAIVKPSRDFLMVELGYNKWITKPDSIKTKSFGYVFKTYLCYDFPIKKSKFSFATGLGIDVNVVYLDKQVINNTDTTSAATFVTSNTYKRYKFVTTYLQAPFELRYFSNQQNRNSGFKAAIGIEVGTLLGAHTKGIRSVSGTNIKDKENVKRYLTPWNFAGTARIGYGNFTLFGSYNFTNVFKDANGPVITPMSVGLCITGL